MLLCVFLLSGCKAQGDIRETVNDFVPEHQQVWTEKSYDFIFGVPEGMTETFSRDDWTCYEEQNGGLEVYTVKLLSSSVNSSVKLISGTDPEKLYIVESSRFSLPEYKFCWCAHSDEGARVYYADIVIDDIYTYGLVCSAPEERWKRYSEQTETVFSTFGLFFDEGV